MRSNQNRAWIADVAFAESPAESLFLGEGRALDTYSDGDNRPFMGKTDKNYSGQHWHFNRIGPIKP